MMKKIITYISIIVFLLVLAACQQAEDSLITGEGKAIFSDTHIDNAPPFSAQPKNSLPKQDVVTETYNLSIEQQGNSWQVYRVNKENGNEELVYQGAREVQSLAARPDGGTLLVSLREKTTEESDLEIYLLNLETQEVQKLTDNNVDDKDLTTSLAGQTTWEGDVPEIPTGNVPSELSSAFFSYQEKLFTAYDAETSRIYYYGLRVAIDGDVMVIAAQDYSQGQGVAYVYTYGIFYDLWTNQFLIDWHLAAKLTASDPSDVDLSVGDENDDFGRALAVHGDTIVVGASGHKHNSNGERVGSVYIFERDHGGMNNWGEVKELLPSKPSNISDFGASVAIQGNTILVGDPYGGNDRDGAFYVFDRNYGGQDSWGEVQVIVSPHARPTQGPHGIRFGASVDFDNNNIIIGGRYGAYVYRLGCPNLFCTDWVSFTQRLISDNDIDGGYYVSISGNTLVVSHPPEKEAYIFEHNYFSNTWSQVKTVTGNTKGFGRGLDISGDTIAIGDCGYEWCKVPQGPAVAAGLVYIFERNSGGPNNWGQPLFYGQILGHQNDRIFGSSVAIDNGNILVGSWSTLPSNGAAYLYY